MIKKELKQEIADWWRTKFHVELKDDICQKLTIDEVEELCNKIAKSREKSIEGLEKENKEIHINWLKVIQKNADLEKENKLIKDSDSLCKLIGEQKIKINELEEQNKWLEGCKTELGNFLGEANNRVAELEKQNSDILTLKGLTERQRETNNELKGKLVLNDMVLTDKTKRIKELEDKLTEKVTLESLDVVSGKISELVQENTVLETRIDRAKECMKKLLFIIKSDPANYNCKGLVQDAEDFIHNRTCHIRQLGEHCISETRCIMCDK